MGATDTITLNRILTTAASWHASDLHFLVGSPPILRVDGRLTTPESEQIVTDDFMEAVVGTFLTEEQRQILSKDKQIVLGYSLNPQVRFKVSAIYQRGSLAISIHFIPTTVKRLDDLGLPPVVKQFTQLPKGLILITGPYGSGRSTTLNAVINEINETRTVNVVTIEQPIEYLFVNNKSVIEQREIGRDALSYEQAIASATHEDVDVIVVAEGDRPEVLAALLEAAEASRLVISTLSTNTIVNTIEKILNSFPASELPKARIQLANVLAGIVSQRLIPKNGGGLVLVSEIMVPTGPVKAVIRDGALVQLSNIMQTSSRQTGGMTLDRNLAKLVKDGIISKEDALANAQDQAIINAVAPE